MELIDVLAKDGLIPACAGKTSALRKNKYIPGAHPRVCGENGKRWPWRAKRAGSSPRVRGKQRRRSIRLPGRGLIPACAGKTSDSLPRPVSSTAHPRVCGENGTAPAAVPKTQGPSPRVRGKPSSTGAWRTAWGLIPACAGKTVTSVRRPRPKWAHPRVCGENTERSGVLTLRSVRSWKTLSFPPSLKVTHCRAFVQLSLSRIRL